jgi:hypothetical protein
MRSCLSASGCIRDYNIVAHILNVIHLRQETETGCLSYHLCPPQIHPTHRHHERHLPQPVRHPAAELAAETPLVQVGRHQRRQVVAMPPIQYLP